MDENLISTPGSAPGEEGCRWRLEDIYAHDVLWEQDFNAIPDLLAEIEKCRGKLDGAQRMLRVLQTRDRIRQLNDKVAMYASMRRDEDNTNPVYQALKDRATSLTIRVQTALSFIEPEILALPAEDLERFRREEPGLAQYGFELDNLLRHKPHILSAAEEQIIAAAGELAQTPNLVFRMLNNADLEFPTIMNELGQREQITHANYGRFIQSGDRRVRREAFTGLYGAYRKLENTLAATLSSGVRRDLFYARVHRFPSAIQADLFQDNVPVEVYDNLVGTVRDHLEVLHRYVALRRKALGLSELHMYDLYAPMAGDPRWEITYPEAVEMVMTGLTPLGGTYRKALENALGSGWVDVYEKKGKTSGAYAEAPYGVHPYVLMNYQNNLHDGPFTLAHEMGHAMHFHMSYEKQPYVYSQAPIFAAEVASTVNESLLMEHLLQTTADPGRRAFLLNHYLEQIRTTLFRQVMFAEFEKIVHEKAEAGEALTSALLRQVYHQLNVDYYGQEIVVDEEIDMEWARIPHFYQAFYVYQYATGLSAATAITRQILDQGEPAVSRYLGFLQKGGSDYPLNLLKAAGIDMTKPQPVQEALNLFARLLGEMEGVVGIGGGLDGHGESH